LHWPTTPRGTIPKTRPAPPDQRRRHAAHRPRCPDLYARAVQGSRAKLSMATRCRLAACGGRRWRSQQGGWLCSMMPSLTLRRP